MIAAKPKHVDLKSKPVIAHINEHRQIALPMFSDNEKLEAELWYDFHKKVKPLWMWLTNSSLYVQAKKPIALTEDRTVTQIPTHRIREIRISTLNLFVQRVIGFSMIAIGSISIIAFIKELISESHRVNWDHPLKYLLLFIAVGMTLAYGATKISMSVYYTTDNGSERVYRYATPFILSNHLREIIFVQMASLSAWAQQKGIRLTLSDSIKTYWKRKEKSASKFPSQFKQTNLARAFQLVPPFSLKPYIPTVIIVIFIAAYIGMMMDGTLSTKDAAESKTGLSVLSILLIISLLVPWWIRRRATLKNLAEFNNSISFSSVYPGIITSVHPTMAAVFYDPEFVKIVWCPELDTHFSQRVSSGTRLSFIINSSDTYRLLPYPEMAIKGTESSNQISAARWSILNTALGHIPVKSAPGLYVVNADNSSIDRAGMLSSTHSRSLR